MTIEELLRSDVLDEFNYLLHHNPQQARFHWLVSSAPAPAQAPALAQAPAPAPARR